MTPDAPVATIDQLRYGQPLTERELDILDAMAAGWTAIQIGRHFAISVRTVHAHQQNAYRKLGVTSGTAAVVAVIREGLIAI